MNLCFFLQVSDWQLFDTFIVVVSFNYRNKIFFLDIYLYCLTTFAVELNICKRFSARTPRLSYMADTSVSILSPTSDEVSMIKFNDFKQNL